jgi:hypothetical protein
MTVTGWLIGLSLSFCCGFVLGAAWKYTCCENEKRSMIRLLERLRKARTPEGVPSVEQYKSWRD